MHKIWLWHTAGFFLVLGDKIEIEAEVKFVFPLSRYSELPKGQLILKCLFGVFKSSKTPTKFFPGFLP